MNEYDDLFKIFLFGNYGVGKTCLLMRLTEDTYIDGYYPSLKVEFIIKSIQIDRRRIHFQIWDLKGRETEQAPRPYFYKNTKGAIHVFSVTDRESFENVNRLIEQSKQCGEEGLQMVLVGTRCDDEMNRKVSSEEGNALAEKHGIPYIETSAKCNININEMFEDLMFRILYENEKEIGRKEDIEENEEIKDNEENEGIEGKGKKNGFCVLM